MSNINELIYNILFEANKLEQMALAGKVSAADLQRATDQAALRFNATGNGGSQNPNLSNSSNIQTVGDVANQQGVDVTRYGGSNIRGDPLKSQQHPDFSASREALYKKYVTGDPKKNIAPISPKEARNRLDNAVKNTPTLLDPLKDRLQDRESIQLPLAPQQQEYKNQLEANKQAYNNNINAAFQQPNTQPNSNPAQQSGTNATTTQQSDINAQVKAAFDQSLDNNFLDRFGSNQGTTASTNFTSDMTSSKAAPWQSPNNVDSNAQQPGTNTTTTTTSTNGNQQPNTQPNPNAQTTDINQMTQQDMQQAMNDNYLRKNALGSKLGTTVGRGLAGLGAGAGALGGGIAGLLGLLFGRKDFGIASLLGAAGLGRYGYNTPGAIADKKQQISQNDAAFDALERQAVQQYGRDAADQMINNARANAKTVNFDPAWNAAKAAGQGAVNVGKTAYRGVKTLYNKYTS